MDVTGLHGEQDFWVVKLNSDGGIQWQKAFGGSDWEYAYAVDLTMDGGYIIAGTTYSTDGDVSSNPHGDGDFWLVKLDNSGNMQWEKSLGGLHNDEAYDVKQTSDGGFILVGYAEMNENSGWVVKTDNLGNIQWDKKFEDGFFQSVGLTVDGGYIVCGIKDGADGWILKLSAAGDTEWSKILGNSNAYNTGSVMQTNDGGYIAAVAYSAGHIAKLNASGNLQWEKFIFEPESNYAEFNSIKQTVDGGYTAAGFDYRNNGNVYIAKLNNSGELIWQKSIGGVWDMDKANSIEQTSDGGYILAGLTYSNEGDVSSNHGISDFWIVKLGADQMSVSEINSTRIAVYPNPVNAVLNFSEVLENIEVYSVSGQKILKSIKGTSLTTDRLSPGTYFLKALTQKGENFDFKFIKK